MVDKKVYEKLKRDLETAVSMACGKTMHVKYLADEKNTVLRHALSARNSYWR